MSHEQPEGTDFICREFVDSIQFFVFVLWLSEQTVLKTPRLCGSRSPSDGASIAHRSPWNQPCPEWIYK